MVTIGAYRISKNAEGEEFVSLMLEGDLTMVQSKETGSWYGTSKKASITSQFNAWEQTGNFSCYRKIL